MNFGFIFVAVLVSNLSYTLILFALQFLIHYYKQNRLYKKANEQYDALVKQMREQYTNDTGEIIIDVLNKPKPDTRH